MKGEGKRVRQRQRGFTLLELLIVMSLMALITAVAAPNFGGALLTLQTRSAVKKVSAILRYARNQAVSTQLVHRVVFDFADGQVLLQAVDGSSHNENGSSAILSPTDVKQIYLLPEKVTFFQAKDVQGEVSTEKFTFVFYPAGNSSGGEITLSGKPGHFYAVTVDFVTGITEVK